MVSDCVAFSSDNVEFNAATPENGNVKFTVTPKMEKDQKPDSFFPRVKMKRGSGTLSTNLHQFSQIRFVEMSVDLWTVEGCCQYPVLPVFSTNFQLADAEVVAGNWQLATLEMATLSHW